MDWERHTFVSRRWASFPLTIRMPPVLILLLTELTLVLLHSRVHLHMYMYSSHVNALFVPGWSYSYFAICVCLSVRPSTHGLGRPGNELMAAADTHGCFELAGLFASLLQKEVIETMPVLSTVEAQLSLHKRSVAKAAPEARKCQETGG